MPLDHYVSQVHLKNFCSPTLGSLMYAIRKNDLKLFTTNARSVCVIEDGSTNCYLKETRVIEEFLKGIEPRYNEALAKLASDNFSPECIYVISGFAAYVLICSPAGMRIHSEPLKGALEEAARILDSKGVLPIPPPGIGGESLSELLHSGNVCLRVNPKYPQAMGIRSILYHITMFGNFTWEILVNPFNDSSFFTSDYPIAIEETGNPQVLNRIVPLAPNLAIRILPDPAFDRKRADFSFSSFRHAIRKLSREEVTNVNRLIVRCAESTVFFRDYLEWIPGFVKKNAKFRIEPRTRRIAHENGSFLFFTQEITESERGGIMK